MNELIHSFHSARELIEWTWKKSMIFLWKLWSKIMCIISHLCALFRVSFHTNRPLNAWLLTVFIQTIISLSTPKFPLLSKHFLKSYIQRFPLFLKNKMRVVVVNTLNYGRRKMFLFCPWKRLDSLVIQRGLDM